MTKRNRNIKNIFIKLQLGTNIMANEVKTPIQNYFEKVLYENHILYLSFLGSGLQINTFFAILTLKINDQSNRT
jgi:hypothetical protein